MSSTAGKIVRSLSFTRRKKTQQMGSSHLGEDEGGEHSSGVRSVTHQEPSGAQGVGRRVTGAAAGAASSAGAVVRSLSFTRRKKKTSGLLPRPNPNPNPTPNPNPNPTQPEPEARQTRACPASRTRRRRGTRAAAMARSQGCATSTCTTISVRALPCLTPQGEGAAR